MGQASHDRQQSDEDGTHRTSTNIVLKTLTVVGAFAATTVITFAISMATSGVAVLGEDAEHDRWVMEHVIQPRLGAAAICGLAVACLVWMVVERVSIPRS